MSVISIEEQAFHELINTVVAELKERLANKRPHLGLM